MNEQLLPLYWSELPTGKENAATYLTLCDLWGRGERTVRAILHELSLYDSGDDYILIRSATTNGFYKTDDLEEIKAFKKECMAKARSNFAPIKKINRVLQSNNTQYSLENNLRIKRESLMLTQSDVCIQVQEIDSAFDKSLLSKMENGICLPNYMQLLKLAEIYNCEPSELIAYELY